MSFPLVRKELREQRPFVAFGLFFVVVEFLDWAIKGLDTVSLAHSFDAGCDASDTLVLVLAFAMGTGLLVREQDDGTLAFLDGLPLTRARLFGVKLGVGWGVLLTYPAVKLVLIVALHLVARTELDRALHLPVLAAQLAVSTLLTLTALAVGMWFGFFRSLAWFLLAVLLSGLALAQRRWPQMSAFDPAEVCGVRLVGARVDWGAEDVAGPVVEASLALAFAWSLFVGRASRLQQALAGVSKRPVLGAVFAVLTMGGALGVMYLYNDRTVSHTPAVGAEPQFTQGARGLKQTEHYRFNYPGTQAADALELAKTADADFEAAHQLLGVAPGPLIDADLSGSMANTAGTAFHERIRIALGKENRETLVHETTHVLARRVATSADRDVWERMNVFNEGLAHWVGRRFRNRPRDDGDRLLAATLHARGEVQLDEFMDLELLAKNRDDGVKYALGAAFVDTLVKRHGDDAVRKVLEAAATPSLRSDLHGPALYQAVFQLAGFDLALVFDDWFKVLEADKQALRTTIASLPRPRAVLVSAPDGWFGIQPVLDASAPDGWGLVVRFRPRPDSALRDYSSDDVEPGDVAWRHKSKLARGEICFQAGLTSPDGDALYEPWQCLPLSSAQPWKAEPPETPDGP